jgi:hypothetical protein
VALWTVTCVFAVPDTGTWTTIPDDPTKTPWRARFVPITDREASDVTSDNKPVMNPAGDPFDPPVIDQYIRALGIEVRGYFKNPDAYLNKVGTFLSTVNKDPFILKPNAGAGGSYTISVGRMKVVAIEAEEYELGMTKPIMGLYRLEWRPEFVAVGQQPRKHPFQKRVRCQGMNAYTFDSEVKKDKIYGKKTGKPVTEPVDLTAAGLIVDRLQSSYGVGPDLLASYPTPIAPSHFDSEVLDGVTFLYFRECPDADFSQLFV